MTIIVFTADHRELGGSHQMHSKGSSIYKEQIHVPMIIRHPAYPGNVRCNSVTSHLDLVPTLVGLTGVDKSKRDKVLAGRKGRDMSTLLAQPEKHRELLMKMNDKLNQLIADEIGHDDGSYIPPFDGSRWDLTAAEIYQYMRD